MPTLALLKNYSGPCQTTAILFELMGQGSGSSNWGRKGIFIRIREQPKIEKEKNQNHQFVYSLLEEHRVPDSIGLWKESRRGQTNLLFCSDKKEDGT